LMNRRTSNIERINTIGVVLLNHCQASPFTFNKKKKGLPG